VLLIAASDKIPFVGRENVTFCDFSKIYGGSSEGKFKWLMNM
jgi:hypothetical protein